MTLELARLAFKAVNPYVLQEEPDQYHLKEGNVLKAESVLRQLAPPDEWCESP